MVPATVTPKCSSALLAGGQLRKPEDLVKFALLHETRGHDDWQDWQAEYGFAGLDIDEGAEFPNLDMATKAAVMAMT